jgi:O-antigen ligase
MTATRQPVAVTARRRPVLPIPDALAAAVAASLPWSTSATGILVALWLLASLPALDGAALWRTVMSAPGGLPVLLAVLGIIGLLWGDVSASERLRGVEPFLRLLMIPVLLVQFSRSERAVWVGAAFLVSATAALATSLAMMLLGIQGSHGPGIAVKDDIAQNGFFALCAFALADMAVDSFARRPIATAGYAALALLFLADIAYVPIMSRTTLVSLPVLYAVWGLHRLPWRWFAGFLLAGIVLGAALWIAAPTVRERLAGIPADIMTGADTSSGARLAFWKGSLEILREAPLLGHGTGTISASFSRHGYTNETARATNPHTSCSRSESSLALSAWRCSSPCGHWIGLLAVTQNIVGSMFNSHLMDFDQAWLYVFAVGAFGGMALRQPSRHPPP